MKKNSRKHQPQPKHPQEGQISWWTDKNIPLLTAWKDPLFFSLELPKAGSSALTPQNLKILRSFG